MEVRLSKLGKRFNRDWIFRNVTFTLESGTSYAVAGPNGSGKSTFLKIVSGFMQPTSGKVEAYSADKKIDPENFYEKIVFAAPYLELIEEFTLREFLMFHFRFKKRKEGVDDRKIMRIIGMESASDKFIINFSSGMKQRLKLAVALFSASDMVFLDEPTVNLDEEGIRWYRENVAALTRNKIVLVASNQPHEYEWTQRKIDITAFKTL